jgi:hypothetical protein
MREASHRAAVNLRRCGADRADSHSLVRVGALLSRRWPRGPRLARCGWIPALKAARTRQWTRDQRIHPTCRDTRVDHASGWRKSAMRLPETSHLAQVNDRRRDGRPEEGRRRERGGPSTATILIQSRTDPHHKGGRGRPEHSHPPHPKPHRPAPQGRESGGRTDPHHKDGRAAAAPTRTHDGGKPPSPTEGQARGTSRTTRPGEPPLVPRARTRTKRVCRSAKS